MVGRLGTAPMSGVAIVNQIVFIFNLTIFGGLFRRFHLWRAVLRKGRPQGLQDTFRFRLLFSLCRAGDRHPDVPVPWGICSNSTSTRRPPAPPIWPQPWTTPTNTC